MDCRAAAPARTRKARKAKLSASCRAFAPRHMRDQPVIRCQNENLDVPSTAASALAALGSLGSPLVFLSGVTGSLWDVYVVLARSICSTRSSPSTKNIKCNNRKGANKSSRNTPESTVVLHGLWVSDIFYWSPRTLSALGDSRWNLTDSLAGIFFFSASHVTRTRVRGKRHTHTLLVNPQHSARGKKNLNGEAEVYGRHQNKHTSRRRIMAESTMV